MSLLGVTRPERNEMNWLNNLIARYEQWQRERAVLDTCGCITYCPHCGDVLNDNSEWQSSDDENGSYRCKKCDGVSTWHFGAPVPILVTSKCPYCSSDNDAIRETYFYQTCAGCVTRMSPNA